MADRIERFDGLVDPDEAQAVADVLAERKRQAHAYADWGYDPATADQALTDFADPAEAQAVANLLVEKEVRSYLNGYVLFSQLSPAAQAAVMEVDTQ